MLDLKYTVKRILGAQGIRFASALYHFGFRFKCEICGAGTRWRRDQGYGYEVLEQLQVVGGLKRHSDVCPVCWSNSRTRLVYLYLKHGSVFLSEPADVLHFAPERALASKLFALHGRRYVPTDLTPRNYQIGTSVVPLDVTKLDLPASSFDLVICCHVLEHVKADVEAMKELHRVMKIGATALVQVPLSLKLASTREGTEPESDEQRIRSYGQIDHVRIYTPEGYAEKLRRTGFNVQEWWAYDELPTLAMDLRIDPFERLFICRKV